ncbi:MAG: hypothetical protein HY908_35270 [Myxococcales bacterium]|nr:hypothetical protein [Myxococcales bacterium]
MSAEEPTPAPAGAAAARRGAHARLAAVLRVTATLGCVAPALWQALCQVRLFALRVAYPADVEWLEGPALYQAHRMLHEQSTYGPPAGGYLPLFHPPGYPAAVAAAGSVFGLDYATGRTVSFLFCALGAALCARELMRHERTRLAQLASAALVVGFAAAGVPLFASFYDLVRGDTMALCLAALAAVLAVEKRPRPGRIALLAVVMTAIVYTRLPAVFFPVWVTVFVFARNRRAGLWLALATTSLCGLVLVALSYATKGWYWIYTVSALQGHALLGKNLTQALGLLGRFAPYLAVVVLVAVALALRRKLSARSALWLGMLGAALPAALLPFAKQGGYLNDLMPVAFFAGPATLCVAADLAHALGRRPRLALGVRVATHGAAALYLVLGSWSVARFAPDARAWRNARAFNELVASLEGGVVIPRAPFIPPRNGHATPQFSDMPYLDAQWAGIEGLRLGEYLDRGGATWAIVTGTEVPYSAAMLAARFRFERELRDAPASFIGERDWPRFLLRRREPEHARHVVFDFEDGRLDGWKLSGRAFAVVPQKPAWQPAIAGATGEQLLSSFPRGPRDAARGRATSPPFVLDRQRLGLDLGGGGTTHVELHVGDRVVARATSVFSVTSTLGRIVWDVSAEQGAEARLVLVDDDKGAWGHVLLDEVALFDP